MALLTGGMLVGVVSGAVADEGMVPLAQSGDWIAFAHHESMTAPFDVCIAANVEGRLAFRSDFHGVQIRVTDQTWSLPANVQGSITITVGTFKHQFDINDNTNTMVNAEVPEDVLYPMFDQMEHSGVMFVTVGKSKPAPVSLTGSTKVTNAFRTCAGIKSNAPSPGSNPFN